MSGLTLSFISKLNVLLQTSDLGLVESTMHYLELEPLEESIRCVLRSLLCLLIGTDCVRWLCSGHEQVQQMWSEKRAKARIANELADLCASRADVVVYQTVSVVLDAQRETSRRVRRKAMDIADVLRRTGTAQLTLEEKVCLSTCAALLSSPCLDCRRMLSMPFGLVRRSTTTMARTPRTWTAGRRPPGMSLAAAPRRPEARARTCSACEPSAVDLCCVVL
jgi:hypothetical protein